MTGRSEGASDAAQTELQRAAAEAALQALVAAVAPSQREAVAAIRVRLQQRLPTAHELVYGYRSWLVISYAPSLHGYEGAVALRVSATELKLYLSVKGPLPDPARLLRGSGKQTRWLLLEGAATLDLPEVQALVESAVARHEHPFPATGRSLLVVRPQTAS